MSCLSDCLPSHFSHAQIVTPHASNPQRTALVPVHDKHALQKRQRVYEVPKKVSRCGSHGRWICERGMIIRTWSAGDQAKGSWESVGQDAEYRRSGTKPDLARRKTWEKQWKVKKEIWWRINGDKCRQARVEGRRRCPFQDTFIPSHNISLVLICYFSEERGWSSVCMCMLNTVFPLPKFPCHEVILQLLLKTAKISIIQVMSQLPLKK